MLTIKKFKILYLIIFLINVPLLIFSSVFAQDIPFFLSENIVNNQEKKKKRNKVLFWAILAQNDYKPAPAMPLNIVSLNFYVEQFASQKPTVQINFGFNNLNQINGIRVLFWVENGQQTWAYPSLDQKGISFRYAHELSEYAVSGIYAIRRIDVLTDDGTIEFTDTSLINSGFNIKYDFNNTKQDRENPVINLFTISKVQYDSGSQNYYVNYSVKASDSQSGLTNDMIIELTNQSGSSLQTRLYFNDFGYAEGRFNFNQYAASGVYVVNTIRLADKAGNNPLYSTSQIKKMGFQTEIHLENPYQDFLPPVLENFTLNQFKINNERGVQLDFKVSDDISGFNRAYIRMQNETGDLYDAWIYANSDKFIIPASHYGQNISVVYFKLYDLAENVKDYSKNDLDVLNFDSEVFIQN